MGKEIEQATHLNVEEIAGRMWLMDLRVKARDAQREVHRIKVIQFACTKGEATNRYR
jgi:hypothetical protein